MKKRLALSSEDAASIISACKARAAELGRNATIAVVDDTGALLHLERSDLNSPISVEAAHMKARTGFLYARATSMLEQRVAERPSFLAMPDMLPVQGGFPIILAGQCIGGVGVGGADKDDEVIASAGLEYIESLSNRIL